jgi:MFS family permease
MATQPAIQQVSDGFLRSRAYQFYIVGFMGIVALMDQYLSSVESTAIPYILAEYQIEAAEFAALKSLFLIVTFFVFALNTLNDLIGRKPTVLVLILLLGLPSLAIALYTPTLMLFMTFYALAMYATVSNMWAIVVGEESPAAKRARFTAVVFVISLLPVQAFLPVLLVERLGLDWRWMYGITFIVMIPALL